MSERAGDVPQRIGDAERDRAAGYLREHLEAGRISAEEFDERIGAVLGARFAADLEPPFTDLPDPRPGPRRVPPPSFAPPPADAATRLPAAAKSPSVPAGRHLGHPVLEVAPWVLWPLTVVLITTLGWGSYWWLVFVPIVLSSFVEQRRKAGGR